MCRPPATAAPAPPAPTARSTPGQEDPITEPITPAAATFAVGKFTVSPLVAPLPGGRYAASVSLRTGRGRASHDRVLRFVPDFDDAAAAAAFATAQGMAWLAEHYGPDASAPGWPADAAR